MKDVIIAVIIAVMLMAFVVILPFIFVIVFPVLFFIVVVWAVWLLLQIIKDEPPDRG